jgi:hypothetical protein
MSIVATARRAADPIPSSSDRYIDLIRHGTVAGHDAGPDDYDAALRDAAAAAAWAEARGLDLLASLARGMVTAILTIDPRDPVPY